MDKRANMLDDIAENIIKDTKNDVIDEARLKELILRRLTRLCYYVEEGDM